MAAAARREFLGSVPALDLQTNLTTNSLVSVTAGADVATVEAQPFTPLLTPLQYVPVFGPLFVTPLIAFLKQVPFIGDILHPIIGYPIGYTGATTRAT